MIGFCHIFAGGEDFADDAAVDECGEFFGLAKIDSTIIYEGLLLYRSIKIWFGIWHVDSLGHLT